MKNIEHVVHLMLENRSLDNVLGWLYHSDKPAHFLPEGGPMIYNGLQTPGDHSNRYDKREFPAQRGTRGETGHSRVAAQPLRVPGFDPGEEFAHVNQQLFGGPQHPTTTNPPAGTKAGMKGFAYDYDAAYETWEQLSQIMECYTPAQLPILNGLASAYAVSDDWYSSVPTQTNPNRAFSLCGTSLGRIDNTLTAVEQFDTPTIWNALPDDTTWAIYYHDIWAGGKCYTEYTFPNCGQALKKGRIEAIDEFYKLAPEGKLPQFTYLEPKWGYGKGKVDGSGFYCGKVAGKTYGSQGNDYHPPTWVGPGEAFVNKVYEALIANPEAWAKTLLIITFDEHGGTYDHVDPGWDAVPPDDHKGPHGFAFNRFGVRVPALLISPWIQAGTVFRSNGTNKLDHTSVLATLLRWRGVDPASGVLGKRTAVAPTLDHVFSDKLRPGPAPRFQTPAGYAKQGAECWIGDPNQAVPPSLARSFTDASRTLEDLEGRVREWVEKNPD